jgi:hypothetical protein
VVKRGGVFHVKTIERKRITRDALREAFEQIPNKETIDRGTISFALACGVIRAMLGTEWFDRYVYPNRKKSTFLTIDDSSSDSLALSMYRIINLSEILYNLQSINGFDECVDKLRHGEIESTYAELDFGRMLAINGVSFRYVIPSGKTGSDYDVEILYPNGGIACADAKCKIEGTAFSVKTVDTTLEKARKQLPTDLPGIVFVKLPPKWLEEYDIERTLISIANDFLRTTRRVVSVKYYINVTTFTVGCSTISHAFKEISNPKTDFGDNLDWGIFRLRMPLEWNGTPPWWQRILFYPNGNGVTHEQIRRDV